MRVQIPAFTDRWMMGDRYGEVVKTTKKRDGIEVVSVKLDKSGKTLRFVLSECTPVD